MKNVAAAVSTLALSLLLVAPTSAQSTGDIELTRAQIQKSRQAIIAKAIEMTEEESVAFWPAYRDYRLDMARVGDRAVRLLEEFVSSNATLTDEQANRMLDEMLDIKAKEASVKQKHAKLFRKVLPPTKVARFFQLENKLDAVVNFELAAAIPLAR